MAQVRWLSGVSGNWIKDPSDWSTSLPPLAGDDVEISVAGNYTVTIGSQISAVNSLTIGNASATVVISDPGITQHISGNLTNTGLLDIESSNMNGVIAYPDQDSSGNQNIFLVEADGTGPTQLTFDTTTDLLPSWSPDGAQLAYVNINSSGGSNIWVINADGSNAHQIAAQASSPAWSPSNTQLAYTSDISGNTEIWTMSPDGSNQKRLTTSPSSSVGNYAPSFSPDGKQIVYAQFSPTDVVDTSLWIMNADGSDQHQLTSGTWNNYDQNGNIINAASSANAPSWGSNNIITFWSGVEDSQGQIWTINPDGSDRKQLTFNPYPYDTDEPEWSPDGTKILYTSNFSGSLATWMMNSDGSGENLLTNITAMPAQNDAAWQPRSTGSQTSVEIGGTLTNTGTMSIGGSSLSGSKKVTATGLVNDGSIVLQGDAAGGAAGQAELDITAGTNSGTITLIGASLLSAGSLTVQSGGSLSVGAGGNATGMIVGVGGGELVSSGGTSNSPTISGGVLALGVGAVVSGGITFSGSGGELLIGGIVMPSSTISGFVPGDTFDLTSIAFDSAGTADLTSANVLEVTEGGTTYDLNLDPGQFFTGDYFHLASDGTSGTLVTENTTLPSPPSPLASSPPPPPTPPTHTSVVLDNFSFAQGWGSANDPRIATDVNGDGNSDYVGFGYSSTFIAYGGTFSSGGSTGQGFTSATAAVNDFGSSEGYTADVQRGAAAAGVGDGDILYGQGYAGVYWYSATGETAATDAAGNSYNVLQYQTSPNFYGNFGSQEGWTSDNGFQILKTDSTDSSASIMGFGDDGIVVGPDAFASGASAASSYVIPLAAGNNSGWKQSVDVRSFTDQNGKPIDLNGDGIADFVGMGPNGLVYAYGSESGAGGAYELGALQTAHIAGGNTDLGEAQGWTDAATPRYIVADPKTGYDDIVAFGAAGVYVAMGQNPNTHNGEPFGQLYLAMADFGSNQGWSVSDTPRLVGDVTGDGIPDIVGFGTSDTYVAVGSRDSSGNLQFKVDTSKTIADFGSAEGWSGSAEQTLRALGTVAGSGGTGAHADLILSGANNTQVWYYS